MQKTQVQVIQVMQLQVSLKNEPLQKSTYKELPVTQKIWGYLVTHRKFGFFYLSQNNQKPHN